MNIKSFFSNNELFSSMQFYRRRSFWLIILGIIIFFVIYQYYTKRHPKPTPGIPVAVATVTMANVPVNLAEIGNVVPTSTITVKTQINGQLLRVLYKEGQMIKKGELLAEIDPRPYEAQLVQFQGQLARDSALLANAELDLNRYQTLWKQDSVAKQTLDTQVSLVKQYQGTVKLDEGQIQATQVNLIYCKITSPVDGRVGLRLVDAGNFVQTTDATGLVVITILNPITVIFSIPEDNVPEVLEKINAGQALIVKAYDRQQNKLLAVGKLLTIDNQIDTTTGTVKLRAEFDNAQKHLFPNQFVNVELQVTILKNAVVVPTAAIQQAPQNNFVFVVKDDQKVTMQTVTTGITYGENTVIKTGITKGQILVIDGADKLQEGSVVTVSPRPTKL